jgi:hypothetical protein
MRLLRTHWTVIAVPLLAAIGMAQNHSLVRIPFEFINNHIYVQVRVNGSRPLSFIVDTGAGTVISAAQAKALGLQFSGYGTVYGSGEIAMEHPFVSRVDFDLQGASFTAKEVAVLPLDDLEPIDQHPIDGLLGKSLFEKFAVEIDYRERTIDLYTSDTYKYRGPGEAIPLKRAGGTIFIRGIVQPEGHPAVSGLFQVDTGGAHALILNRPVVDANEWLTPEQKLNVVSAKGIGSANVVVGSVRSLTIGDTVIDKPITLFSRASKGFFASNSFLGSIGDDLLKQKRVIFDYKHKVMVLEPYSETRAQ